MTFHILSSYRRWEGVSEMLMYDYGVGGVGLMMI